MNAPQFFFEGDPFFESLSQTIAEAQKSIDVEFYYFASDAVGEKFSELLRKKAKEGVVVRLIYDAVGCRETERQLFTVLKRDGVFIKTYNPLFPLGRHFKHRNHRKLVIIDGAIAYLGGFNMSSEFSHTYFGKSAWRDTGVRLQNSTVSDLVKLFELNWVSLKKYWGRFFQTGPLRPDWTQYPWQIVANEAGQKQSLIRQEYLSAIIHAQKYLYLTNPYFVPDRGLRRALKRTAARGVDVKLLTAGVTDVKIVRWASHGMYDTLLKSGMRIFEYQDRVLHAKSAVSDGTWYTVGTANLDHLSLFHNLEVNLFGSDVASAELLTAQFQRDLENAKEILLSEWNHRSWFVKMREKIFYYFRAWL